jgi:hypothetical protein
MNPGTGFVYYRLIPEKAIIVDKTHIPYLMDKARLKRWQELFIDADFEIQALPGYEVKSTSNPFIIYKDLPVKTRYQFLADDAQLFIMGFINGSVCRGNVALSVTDESFWVFFVDPKLINEKTIGITQLCDPIYRHSNGSVIFPARQLYFCPKSCLGD